MTVSLTQAEAMSKISQIESARDHAIGKLRQIEDSQQQMLSTGWQGQSATKYGNVSATQRDDIDSIIKNLSQIVTTATGHIHSLANLDNG